MKNTNATIISTEEIQQILSDTTASKTLKIKMLFDGGVSTKDIALLLGIRYQFAYNILSNHIIKNDIVVEKAVRTSNNGEILLMLADGKSLADISRATKMNYNQVWKIARDHGFTQKQQTALAQAVGQNLPAQPPVLPEAPEVIGVKKVSKSHK